jgi:hypothetical protein
MGRVLAAIVVLAMAACLFVEFCGVSLCDGAYALDVRVRSASGALIEAVSCEVCDDAHHALPDCGPGITPEQLLASPTFRDRAPSGAPWQATARPFHGQVLEVMVPESYRVSILLERERGYSQWRGLVLVAEYPGNRRFGRVVDRQAPRRALAGRR